MHEYLELLINLHQTGFFLNLNYLYIVALMNLLDFQDLNQS